MPQLDKERSKKEVTKDEPVVLDSKKRVDTSIGTVENEGGYFRYDTATTHHATNKPELLTNIQRGGLLRGHGGPESVCKMKGTLTFYHRGKGVKLTGCLYDPTYSALISGQCTNSESPHLTMVDMG